MLQVTQMNCMHGLLKTHYTHKVRIVKQGALYLDWFLRAMHVN